MGDRGRSEMAVKSSVGMVETGATWLSYLQVQTPIPDLLSAVARTYGPPSLNFG